MQHLLGLNGASGFAWLRDRITASTALLSNDSASPIAEKHFVICKQSGKAVTLLLCDDAARGLYGSAYWRECCCCCVLYVHHNNGSHNNIKSTQTGVCNFLMGWPTAEFFVYGNFLSRTSLLGRFASCT